MIQLHFDKLYSGDRNNEHCQAAIPFAKGTLSSTNGLRIFQNGIFHPAQYKITSKWEDGSIRWLHIRFLANLPSNKATDCYLVLPEEQVSAIPNAHFANQVTESNGTYTVSTGALTFSVSPHSNELLHHVTQTQFGQTYDSYCFAFPNLVEELVQIPNSSIHSSADSDLNSNSNSDSNSNANSASTEQSASYTTDITSWKLLENGALVTILEGQAVLSPSKAPSSLSTKELHVEIRLTAWAGKPWVEMEYRLINTSDDPLHIQSLTWTLSEQQTSLNQQTNLEQPTNLEQQANLEHQTISDNLAAAQSNTTAPVRTCAAHSNYTTIFHTSESGEPMRQLIDSHLLLYEANEHFSEVFYGTLFCDRTTETKGLCATVFQGQQNYPKAVEANEHELIISLVPQCSDKVIMQSGMARCQRVLLHFHDATESLQSLNNRSTIYQMPDKCHIAPEIFHNANVFEDVFPQKRNAQFEKVLSMRADAHSRCYGMLNWGDSPDPGYTSQGRGGDEPVWTNNEYDYPHACYLLYARTGIRRFLDYGLVTSEHWMDVDVCHYSNDPLLFGGQWQHTNGHCKNIYICCSHEWVEGLLDTWHFTGNPRALETAFGIGENVLRLLETPMFHQKGGINARETGWALRTLVALYKETFDEKWLVKADWIVGHFTEWKEEYGQWLSPYMDNVAIHVVFMISIAVGSLMRYYRIRPNQHIKDMIIDAVDDMIENCLLEDGTFYYKELPSLSRSGTNTLILEALQNAYELTGNVDYLKPGLITFKNDLQKGGKFTSSSKKHVGDSVISQGDGTKNFAQSLLPLTLYYKAASDAGLL